jgi:hypothetical protein
MTPGSSFLSTYAAVRFSTGKKAPGVVMPLMKAFGLICYCILVLPIYLLRLLLTLVQHRLDRQAPTQPRPTFPTGRPRRFSDSVADLQEDMK